jgi:hypothetical protein
VKTPSTVPKGIKRLNASDDKTEGVTLPARNKSASRNDQPANYPAEQNKDRSQYDKKPSHNRRRLIAAVAKLFWGDNEENTDHDVNNRYAGK